MKLEVDQNTMCRCEFGPEYKCGLHDPRVRAAPMPRHIRAPSESVTLGDYVAAGWRLLWSPVLLVAEAVLVIVVCIGWGPERAREARELLQ